MSIKEVITELEASSVDELIVALSKAFALLDELSSKRGRLLEPPSDQENKLSKKAYATYEILIEAVGADEAEKLTS
jgi:hypothetical protein